MADNERVHFKIALPVELKQRLEHAAIEHRRSVSAEIIHRLEASFPDISSTGTVHQAAFAPNTAVLAARESGADTFSGIGAHRSLLHMTPEEVEEFLNQSIDTSVKKATKKYGLLLQPGLFDVQGLDAELTVARAADRLPEGDGEEEKPKPKSRKPTP